MQSGVTVGNVVAAVCTFMLQTTNTIPKSAEVQIKMRLTDGAETNPTTSEWLPCGTFYVSKRKRDPITGAMAFECYDALLKGDAVWEPASSTWPQAMTSVVSELLTILGLQLDSRTTINSNYTLPQPEAGATIRDVLGIIAQYHGGNWTITPANKLRLVPIVDAADAEEAESNVIDVSAVIDDFQAMPAETITGLRRTYDDATVLIGTDTGIVIDVSIPAVVAADLADTLVGKTYQVYSLGTAYYDYAVELGDYVRYSDDVASVLYAETVELGPGMSGNISAPDTAEIQDEYPYIGNSQKTLIVAKAYAEEVSESAVEDYDDTWTQQKTFNKLTENGTAQGLVLLNGQLYMNATYINTGYMSANRLHGGTLTLGGQNNQSGVLNVVDAQGNTVGTWDNSGISITDGNIRLPYGSTISLGFASDNSQYFKLNNSGMKLAIKGGSTIETGSFVYSGSAFYPSNIEIGELYLKINNGNDYAETEIAPGRIVSGYCEKVNNNTYYTSRLFLWDLNSFTVSRQDDPNLMDDCRFQVDLSSKMINIIAVKTNIEGDLYVNGSVGGHFTGDLIGSVTGDVVGNVSGSSGSCTGNAATATKATNDSDGNAINTTYLKKSGGTMTGDINFGSSGASSAAKSAKWTTADGTIFQIRPYNNLFQITRQPSGGSVTGALNINSDGTISFGEPAKWRTAMRVFVNMSASSMTNEQIYNALNNAIASAGAYTATVYISGAVASVLTNSKVTGARFGTVTRYTSDSYRFSVTQLDGSTMNTWSTTVSKSGSTYTVTPGTVYKYTGTAI